MHANDDAFAAPAGPELSQQADPVDAGSARRALSCLNYEYWVLTGFGSAGVLEVVEDDRGSTYRAVYTVKFAGWVYVLHCFQKKSKSGIKTPKADMDLIHSRLMAAKQDFEARQAEQGARR